jgi:hypothetical protein
LGGGGQGLKEIFGKLYSDVACKAWLILKILGRVGILNLCRNLIVINEGLGIVNVQLTQVQLTCSWNIQLHLNVIASNKENLQRRI